MISFKRLAIALTAILALFCGILSVGDDLWARIDGDTAPPTATPTRECVAPCVELCMEMEQEHPAPERCWDDCERVCEVGNE